MFTRSADIYDAIYDTLGKDYAREAAEVHRFVREHKRSEGNALLDVACGTGHHLVHLRENYEVEGLDIQQEMIDIARGRNPGVPFHRADMLDFDLGRTFDAVVCLFSSIGYAKTAPEMKRAVACMARHLRPGGVLLFEPWLTPDVYKPGVVWAHFVDRPDLKIARMNVSAVEDGVSLIEFHYLVARPGGIEHFTERHELGLFTREEYEEAVRAAGLDLVYDAEGLFGNRGLFLGLRPSQ